MALDDDAGGPVPFEAPHRTQSCLETPVVSLHSIVGVLSGVVHGSRKEVRDSACQGVGPVGSDFRRSTMGPDRIGDERCDRVPVN